MTNHDLGAAIQRAALDFSAAIVRAIRGASLQELLEMQGLGGGRKAASKPGRKKAGPKPGKKKIGRPAKAGRKAKAPAKKAKVRQRLSGDEKRAVLDAIVVYLAKHPASKGPAVAAALGLESKRVGAYLKELRAAKRVTTKGAKVTMVYSAAPKRKRVVKKIVVQPAPAKAPTPAVEAPPVDPPPPVEGQ
ncbi:MAG TPA: hypothetical protein VM389_14460 [Phycisphaerae bacterium]|nr:hypothetical protein [Phycisphaerae bacterium]